MMMRKNKATIRKLLGKADLTCPPARVKTIERGETARWQLLEEDFHLVRGMKKYRVGNILEGENAQGGQVILMDLETEDSLQTVVLFTDLDLPDLRLAPRNEDVETWVPDSLEDEVRMEHDEKFADRFQLAGNDEHVLQELFNPSVRRFLLRLRPGLEMEVKNGFVLVCWPGLSWDLGDYQLFARILTLVDLLHAAGQPALVA
jgi:hypothetical protein